MDVARLAPVLQNIGGLGLAIVTACTAAQVDGAPVVQPLWLVVLAFVAGWLVKDPQAAARWLAVGYGRLRPSAPTSPQQPADPADPAGPAVPTHVSPVDDLTPVESLDELERAAPPPRP